jgi:hypothetical protein
MESAARVVLVSALLAIAGVSAYAFFSIFEMQASPGGIGSGVLAVLLAITAGLAARKAKKPRP